MARAGTVRIGISGWTYAPWRGVFYPKGLPQKRELEYAASQFNTLEINGTFYGMQRPDTFADWADADAGRFRVRSEGAALHHAHPSACARSRRRWQTSWHRACFGSARSWVRSCGSSRRTFASMQSGSRLS